MPRINRAVELLAAGQPVFSDAVAELTYGNGVRQARTWADCLIVDLEHHPFDMTRLSRFMQGLVAGGPTDTGHRTPAVIVTLPTDGSDARTVRTNRWMIQQTLATGVHGLILCHAEAPAAVKAFVEGARYSFQDLGVGSHLEAGRRGSGGQQTAAEIWGLAVTDYLECADVWPLNPSGELMLGLKIENRRALVEAAASVAVPGIAFAEWGPGDMGMSYGYREAHDPPYSPDMLAAREQVKTACDQAGIAFFDIMQRDNVVALIDAGVKIGATTCEVAEKGRQHNRRKAGSAN